MIYLGLFLTIYGILLLYLTLSKSSFIFKNFKVKALTNKMGEKNTFYFLLILSIISLLGGIYLIQ